MALPQGNYEYPETKKKLFELVEVLPEHEIIVAEKFLEFLVEKVDPFLLVLLNAPESDEEHTEEDLRDIKVAREEIKRGETKTLEEVAKEMGIEL